MKKQFQSKSVPRGTRTIWRYLGALFILFTFAIGNVWGADYTIYQATSSGVNTANKTETGISVTFNSFKAVSNSPVTTVADATYGIEADLKAPRWGGGGDGKNIKVTVSDNYTATITVYVQTSAADKTVSIKSGSESGTEIVSVNCAAIETVYRVQASDLAAGDYYIKAGNDKVGLIKLVATVTSTGGGGGGDTEAPTLSSSIPANSATDVDVAGNIVLTMSENVTIADASKFSISGGAGSLTTASITASGTTVTIPYTGLANSTAYTLTVAADAIQDGAATPNKNAAFSISFTTAAPVVEPDYLLINQSNGNINTTHFRYTGSSSEKSGGYTVGGTKYNRYTQLGGAFTTPVGVKETNKIVSYDAKTNSVTAEAWIFNKASSTDYKFYISMIEEGTKTPTIKEFDAPKNSGTKVSWTFTPTKNATIYLTVGNNSNVHVCQFGITESGTDLLRGGQIGYSVRLDSCRLANNKNATPFVMDGISYLATSNTVNIWTPGNPVKLKAITEYIKFTLPENAKVSIKASGTYSVTKTAEYSAGASMSGNQNVNLAADTWYICPNGSNVTFASLEFLTPDVANAVTYSAGEGSVKEGKSLPTQADAVAGEKFNLASGENLERSGYDFKGWKANGTGDLLLAGAEYTMGSAAVEFVAQWDVHVAKYGVKFMDGTTKLDSLSVTLGQAPVFADPTQALYTFAGWKDGGDNDVTLSDLATSVTVENTVVVLYAQWTKVYVPQGASYVFENTATVGTAYSITVTKDNQPNAIAADSRIDNMWLSAMSVKLEDGTYSGSGDDFKGWKINTASATIRFYVENDSRVTVTVGNLTSGLNITYTAKNATEEATTALTAKAANPYDVKGGTLVTLTTGGGSTVTLKGIAVSAIPALDDDATLSDLKVGGVTVAGFSANTHTYYYELPYGTAVGDIPAISATANSAKAKQVAIEQAVWTGDPYNCYRAQANVQAEDESWGYYDVQFSFAPKYGVELIKATHDGTASGATITGYIGGQKDKDTYANGKLGEIGKYFGIKLADGNFQAGDLVEVKVSMFEGGNTATMFTDKGETPLSSGAFDVNNKVYRFTLTAETEWIYIYRKDGTCNPRVQSIAVYRQMNPFIEEFKIGEAVGTITGTNIAIELPYGTSLYGVAATIEAYANGGATVIAPTPLAYDTPLGYKVSSAYAEDGDVDYTVTITEAEHYEAMIVGGANYETLAAAVAAAQADDVVKLLDNVDLMATGLTIAENITLDLNGFNIKAGEQIDNDIVVPAGKKLTLVDNFANAEGKIYTEQAYTGAATGYGLIRVAGELLMQSGNIYAVIDSDPANLGQFAVVIAAGGKVTVEGGQIKAGWYAISNNGNNTGSTIIVSGGELISTADFAIYNPAKESTVTVSGGVVYGAAGGIAMNRGELTVTGGTITSKDQGTTGTWGDGTGGLSNAAIAASGKYESVEVEISGGTIIAEGTAVMITNGTTNPVEVAISGGQFSHVVPAEYCAEGFAPVTTPNAQGKYEVIAAGVIRGAAVQDAEDVYYYTLDNGVTIYSSQSDGRLNTSNHIATSGDIEPCGGDHGGYNVNQSKFVLKFPVNVKEFTLYGANSTERTISKIYVNAEASKDIKISTVGRELTGTYTNTKDGKCQTLTAAFNDANIIPANYYVLVTLSGTANIYRVLYTEAECTTPTVTVADQTAKDGVAVTLTAEASALGATYQWYTCDDAQGTNPVIIPSETAKTLSVTKSGADDQFYKVVVGCNCSAETAEDVAKVSLYTEVTTLVDVTENTVWDWSTIVNDVDGAAITSGGKKVNGANGILANYIQGTNMDKVESNNGAYAIRSNSNQYYQGASLHMHTTKGGILKIHARSDGNTMTLNVQNAGRDIEIGSLGNWKDYTIYVQAGDVVIYNVPETAGKPMRIDQMTFTVKETPDYPRNVSSNYGTLCVEHNVLVGGAMGATFYQIASRNEDYDYKIDFEEVLPNEELKAGEPYLFKSNTGKIELFYGEETAATPIPVRGMIGNYAATTLAITEENKNTIYYFAQNKLWLCDNLVGGSLTLNDHRAYIDLTQVPTYAQYEASKQQQQNSAPRRRVSLEMNGEKIATGCENLNVSDKPVKMIIDGQLFILRGEKMYDAKGQLVK